MTKRTMTDEEFEQYFDEGGDTTAYMVEGSLRQPNRDEVRRVNFNMPVWLIDVLDEEARHLAIPRQAVAITWLAERARKEHVSA